MSRSPKPMDIHDHQWTSDDYNFYVPDSPDTLEPIRRSQIGTGNPSATRFLKRAKKRPKFPKKRRKLPKIFLTDLPLNELQDPEIFFTKIIKENDSSIQILPSELGPDELKDISDSPSLMYEEIRVYEDAKDYIIEKEEVGPVRRSNLIYQDGLRNVNAMIFNSQNIEEKGSRTSEKSSGWETEGSTHYPRLDSVSSTAMVFQVLGKLRSNSLIVSGVMRWLRRKPAQQIHWAWYDWPRNDGEGGNPPARLVEGW